MAVAMGRLPATARRVAGALRPGSGDNTDFHVLSRFADVFRAVRDTETFSSARASPRTLMR